MAQGTFDGKMLKIAVSFQAEDFGQLNALAVNHGKSLSKLIREFTLKELARHDQP